MSDVNVLVYFQKDFQFNILPRRILCERPIYSHWVVMNKVILQHRKNTFLEFQRTLLHFHGFNDSKTLCTLTPYRESACYRTRLTALAISERKLCLLCVLWRACSHVFQMMGLNSDGLVIPTISSQFSWLLKTCVCTMWPEFTVVCVFLSRHT